MAHILERLQQQCIDLLRDLASRPFILFCLLLAANAVALPYRNFYHDANLYGVQVLNRLSPGRFADDLYFKYGSQDRYSVFSLVVAPVVAQLGLPAGFFVLYFTGNALFLLALQRFVRALVKAPIVSTLALFFLAITEIPFGGLHVFHVNEPFLTPRIAANALVLFGLERLIAGRSAQAFGLVLLPLPLHPLMALPGVLIVTVWLGLRHLRTRSFLALLCVGALAAVAVLLDRPLASHWFGSLDDAWLDSISRVNPHLFPLGWKAEDWLRIILSFTVVLTAARYFREDAPVRCSLIAMSLVAAIGLAGGIMACFLPYALPLQGQPYRWLWPLELSLYPLGFLVAQRLWAKRHEAARLAALTLLVFLNDTPWDSSILWLLASSTALFGIILWRGLSAQPHVRDWAVCAAAFSLGLTLLLWTTFKLALFVNLRSKLAALLEPVELLQLLATLIDPLCRLALTVLSAILLARLVRVGYKFGLSCLSVTLASLLIFFVWPQTRLYMEKYARHKGDERFLAAFLAKHSASGAIPMVYWPTGRIHTDEHLWLNLRLPSYFHVHQVVGNLFHSGNAAEGARRVQIVKRFELECWRKENPFAPPDQMRQILKLYHVREDEPPPRLSDFLRLCQEEQLDFAFLPQEFPGLYTASTGHFFIYDCRALRARLNSSPCDSFTPTP